MLNTIICGKNLEILRGYPDNHFHAVVTDSPYGLGKQPDAAKMLQAWLTDGYYEVKGSGFMGKKWDAFVPQPLFWKEVMRVLKPGGHVLSFFGTRTQDLGVLAMRLAGFEIRDSLMWVYGSGFPKSLDIGKTIDKRLGVKSTVIGNSITKSRKMNGGKYNGERLYEADFIQLTRPNSDAAKLYEGYGTALKPAHEPIVLARKPLVGTVADNVLVHGCGGLNLAACRIGSNQLSAKGRFPANFLLDEYAAMKLDEQAPKTGAFAKVKSGQNGQSRGIFGDYVEKGDDGATFYDDGLQGASRFFYVAKASKKEREAGLIATEGSNGKRLNIHPTVKPIKLMQYLVRLVTPIGGIVLDPFCGSGSTLCAAAMEGFSYVGIEQDHAFVEISKGRVNHWATKKPKAA